MTDEMRVPRLLEDYRTGRRRAGDVVHRARARAAASEQPAWIALLSSAALESHLARADPAGPLYGVPFAIKDNIDLAGVPTTAACPTFARTPRRHAGAVERLLRAGAVPVGKTNMDQFATGLVGTRTPHGSCWSTIDPRHISGGSSSGSAVAVAEGQVSFALGTDTAGSGRVPAAFNELVGLKPSFGLIGASGVVPACRTLDCVTVFTADVAGAAAVLEVAGGSDPADPFSRTLVPLAPAEAAPRIAVPREGQIDFAGDQQSRDAFRRALERAQALGWILQEIDVEPLLQVASLLYDGPWVAERAAAVGAFIAEHADDVDPVVSAIITSGWRPSAVDAFRAMYRLAELRAQAERVWDGCQALLMPTAPTIFTHEQIAADPVAHNSTLGAYTNFVNLLDLCAIAVPGPRRADGLPFGISLIAPAGGDQRVLALAAEWTGEAMVPAPAVWTGKADAPAPAEEGLIPLAVVGAHLAGQPLNGELTRRGGRLLRRTRTAGHYRLYALAGGHPPRPGLEASDAKGPGIEVELWGLSPTALGELTAGVPAPLAIGRVELEDGEQVSGFVCEPRGIHGAREITHLGGWRAHLLVQAPARG